MDHSGDVTKYVQEAASSAAVDEAFEGDPGSRNRRILIIDDNEAIHRDFRKILIPDNENVSNDLMALEEELFGHALSSPAVTPFEVDNAMQGQEGLELVVAAGQRGRPYAMAFVDVRMPPGWDGIETIQRIWRVDPAIQIVLCTAYSDYSWAELSRTLGESDRLLILRKPFDKIEVRQLVVALCEKWALLRERQSRVDDLEALVRERTRELEEANHKLRDEMSERLRMEQELRESQKLQALGRLSEGMRHEINNPLCFVAGNLEFIDEEIEDMADELADELDGGRLEEIRGAIGEAMTGAERIQNILRDVKLYAQADDGAGDPIDVNQVLDTAIALVGDDVKHRAALVVDAGHLPPILGEARRLEQVFFNLLLNASQAIAPGQAERNEIRVTTSSEPSGFAVIEIRDTGEGIAQEQRDRVFEPFYTTRPVGQGTGLGLSICRSVVVAFGGTLLIDSEVGRGTVVTVRLPLASGQMTPDAVECATCAVTAPGISQDEASDGLGGLRGLRILLVDDEPLVLELLKRSLRDHMVHLARDGRQALEILAARSADEPIDLVFCDLMMPDMSGMELYQHLSRDDPALTERIVFITGGAFNPHIREFLKNAGNHCIEKPFSRSEILRVVQAYREGQL